MLDFVGGNLESKVHKNPGAYRPQRNKTKERVIVNSVTSTVGAHKRSPPQLGKPHSDLEEVTNTSWRK